MKRKLHLLIALLFIVYNVNANNRIIDNDDSKKTSNQNITVTAFTGTFICEGTDIIQLSTSEVGRNYFLRNDADNSIVAGPVAGTGSTISFSTGLLTETTTFNVFEENQNPAGTALGFDGVDEYVNIPDTPSLNPTSALTIEAWVKLDALGTDEVILDKRSTNVNKAQYNITVKQDGKIEFSIGLPNPFNSSEITEYVLESLNPEITAGQWYRISCRWDGTFMQIFKNGLNIGNSILVQGTMNAYNTNVTIGGIPTTSNYGNVQVDDVRIWNVARGLFEIFDFYNVELTGNETGLMAYYSLNEGTGITTTDLTVNANNGDLINMEPSTDWVTGSGFGNAIGELPETVTVTVNPIADPVATLINEPQLCEADLIMIEITTEVGVKYSIRDTFDNSVLTLGQVVGNGGVLVLTTTIPVFETTNLGVFAEIGSCSTIFAVGTAIKLIEEQLVTITENVYPPFPTDCEAPFSHAVTLLSSEIGVNYYLRDHSNNMVINGPIQGTGSAINFPQDPNPIYISREYNVLAEKYSTSLDFDGVDDVVIANAIDLSGSNTMTIEAWINPNDITTNSFYEIVRQQSPASGIANLDWLLSFQNNGTILSFGLKTESEGYNELDVSINPTDFTDGNWHHVAAVYNGANRYLYLDGSIIGSDSKTGTIAFTASQLAIGSSHLLTTENFNGKIDELRFWNAAKTQTEIQAEMNETLKGRESGLVACYNFDEASGAITRDLVKDNNGVLTNMDASTDWQEGALITSPLCVLTLKDTAYLTILGGCAASLTGLKVYLQGPLLNPNTGEETLMRDNLRALGGLPTLSPYNDGLTCNATVFNVGGTLGTGTVNDDIVDWIWIELRDATNNTVIEASRSALLQRDGDVVDVDGVSSLLFNAGKKEYYIAIKHRNHLGVITANTVDLSNSTIQVDFTDAMNPITFGTNAQTSFGISSGLIALWAGDANADGRLNYLGTLSDIPAIRSQVFNDPDNSVFGGPPVGTYASQGYNTTDINMDGVTVFSGAASDVLFIRNNIFNNPSNSVFGGPPVATYVFIQQLPEGAN